MELFNAAPTDVALDGLYLELVNGANGAVYANIDLAQAGAALFATLTGAGDTVHLCLGAAEHPGLHEKLATILRDTTAHWTPTEP